jgi:hypothetical protein
MSWIAAHQPHDDDLIAVESLLDWIFGRGPIFKQLHSLIGTSDELHAGAECTDAWK